MTENLNHLANELIEIAQNDYMIDNSYLPGGQTLIDAATLLFSYKMREDKLINMMCEIEQSISNARKIL